MSHTKEQGREITHTLKPWTRKGKLIVAKRSKTGPYCWVGKFALEEDAIEAVACVNALEGYNPEVIPEMVEFLREYADQGYKLAEAILSRLTATPEAAQGEERHE